MSFNPEDEEEDEQDDGNDDCVDDVDHDSDFPIFELSVGDQNLNDDNVT